MAWLWVQSLVLIVLTFAGGLWLGKRAAAATARLRRHVATAGVAQNGEEEVDPAYHGVEQGSHPPQPQPQPQPHARTPLLFPVNQFGVITVTQAPA